MLVVELFNAYKILFKIGSLLKLKVFPHASANSTRRPDMLLARWAAWVCPKALHAQTVKPGLAEGVAMSWSNAVWS